MFKLLVSSLVVFGTTAFAQTPVCDSAWTVQSARAQKSLSLILRETGVGGPACDLVVKGFDYLDGAGILNVEVAAAKFCPVDAIAQRRAYLTWQLPEELRSKGQLKLIVNGFEVGILSVGPGEVGFKGGCQ